ncbi:hypothetical protein [Glaciimonas soli]|uniref:Uncharacterized protein n=1 Tax=Glaciimonas soli TaxID=2590999 RepID=A0A843Z0J4_9BURK|nr:hypothetical protein [Glaciimonas soli]MQR02356.1 hypothetical protein [Glaciimonas soli]
MKKLIFFSLLSLSLSAFADIPPEAVRHACVTGTSQSGVKISAIPFGEITEDDSYAGKYRAKYSTFKGVEIGYAKKDGLTSIFYGKRFSPVSAAALINVSKVEYKGMLEKGDVELDQNTNWSLIATTDKKQYLCAVLSRQMEKAPPMAYMLSISTKPHHLYFQLGQ